MTDSATNSSSIGDFGRGLRPAEGIAVGYLLWSAVTLCFFHAAVEGWGRLILANLVMAALVFAISRFAKISSAPLALARRILPLVFIPIFYSEVANLNDMFFPQTYFDATVIVWEKAIFDGNVLPLVLHEWWPWKPLAEYLHFAYFAYYLVIPTPFVAFALRGRWDYVESYLTALMLIFVSCQLWFIFFPVQGPFHEFPPPDPQSMGSFFPPFVHSIVHSGSSVGSAFPSSHCAVAAICWIVVMGKDRTATWILAAIVPALTVGTIYGGFHYGVDALAGWALTLLTAPLAFRLHRRWEARRRDPEPALSASRG